MPVRGVEQQARDGVIAIPGFAQVAERQRAGLRDVEVAAAGGLVPGLPGAEAELQVGREAIAPQAHHGVPWQQDPGECWRHVRLDQALARAGVAHVVLAQQSGDLLAQ